MATGDEKELAADAAVAYYKKCVRDEKAAHKATIAAKQAVISLGAWKKIQSATKRAPTKNTKAREIRERQDLVRNLLVERPGLGRKSLYKIAKEHGYERSIQTFNRDIDAVAQSQEMIVR